MATKKELTAEILELDPNAAIDADASHDDLTAQLKAVKETRDSIDDAAAAEKPAAEKPAAGKGYKVPKGKAITTLVGMRGEGCEITAKMVTGGADKLKLLKSKGLLV